MGNDGFRPALLEAGPLTLEESRVIAALLDFPTLSDALAFAGVTPQWHGWHIRKSPAYAEAMKRIGESLLTEARAKLDSLMPQVADTFEEALDATTLREFPTTCPKCGEHFDAVAPMPDLKMRLGVARDLLKRSGDLQPKLKVEGEIKHRDMSLEDKLALAQVQRGLPVPPDVFASLKDRGLLPANLQVAPGLPAPGQEDSPPQGRSVGAQSNSDTSDSDTLKAEYRLLPPQAPETDDAQ